MFIFNNNMQILSTTSSARGVNNYRPVFCALRPKTLSDVFHKSTDKGLKELTGFYKGVYGTECKGSKPLKNFLEAFKPNVLKKLISHGQSTNINGHAYSFLKTCADNPVSTSKVYDCSVMYLYNKGTNTHFLYHIYKDNKFKDIEFLIKTCMPEGFTHAAIVSGSKYHKPVHENYLPQVFDAIKQNCPNSIINAYHYSSTTPEIVFLKGKAYEIPNPHGYNAGQASFKIKDYRTYETFYEVNKCSSIEDLDKLSGKIKSRRIDKEVKKILQSLIKERKEIISQIQSCKTFEELDEMTEVYGGDSNLSWMPSAMGICGYYDVIKRQGFKIAEQNQAHLRG